MKFTTTTVAELGPPAGQSEAMLFDDDHAGLALRIRKSGTRTWVFQYRIGIRIRRMTLGDAGVLPLAKARKMAADLHAKVRLGGDPAADKEESRRDAEDTLAKTLVPYLAHQRTRLRPQSLKQVERHLLNHCKPLHQLPLTKVDRRAVAARIAAIAASAGPVAGNRVRSTLAAFFSWCIREGLAHDNPAAGGSKAPEKSRQRVLTDDELKALWQATADGRDYSEILRLLLLTGCRANEIGQLRWSEVHDDQIVLPPERVKNNRTHVIPLSTPAKAILTKRTRVGTYVFGRGTLRPFAGWSACKYGIDKTLGDAVAHWVVHDLRRTCVTKMADLNISPHIIEACINHASGHRAGVCGIYNRAGYAPQKRHAFDTWAAHLTALVEGREAPSSVVPLRA